MSVRSEKIRVATTLLRKFFDELKDYSEDPEIKAYLSETPDDIAPGKDLFKLATEDIQHTFEAVFAESDRNHTPYQIYETILSYTEPERQIQGKRNVLNHLRNRNKSSAGRKYVTTRPREIERADEKYPRFLYALNNKIDDERLLVWSQMYQAIFNAFVGASETNSMISAKSRLENIQVLVGETVDKIQNEQRSKTPAAKNKDTEKKPAQDYKYLSTAVEDFIKEYGVELKTLASERVFKRKQHVEQLPQLMTPVEPEALQKYLLYLMSPGKRNVVSIYDKHGMNLDDQALALAEYLHIQKSNLTGKLENARIIEFDMKKLTYIAPTSEPAKNCDFEKLLKEIDTHNKSGKAPIILSFKNFGFLPRAEQGYLAHWSRLLSLYQGAEYNVPYVANLSTKESVAEIQAKYPDFFRTLNLHSTKDYTDKQVFQVTRDWLLFGDGQDLIKEFGDIDDGIIRFLINIASKNPPSNEQALPQTIKDLLHIAASSARLAGRKEINEMDALEALKLETGKTQDELLNQIFNRMASLNGHLKSVMVNQDEAIDTITPNFDLVRHDDRDDEERPIGVFMCIGPTGTGKTELPKEIARHLKCGFVKINLGEHIDKHGSSGILGANPGYVGYNDKQELEKLNDNEYNVLLLDEWEKLHPELMKLFLNAFDEGYLTLKNGVRLDLRKTIIFCSSNQGEKDKKYVKQSIGYRPTEDLEDKKKEAALKAVDDMLDPEYQGRFDGIIYYNNLKEEHIKQIVQNQINALKELLVQKKRVGALEIDDTVVDEITESVVKINKGARPVKRKIARHIKRELSKYNEDHPGITPLSLSYNVSSALPEFKCTTTDLSESFEKAGAERPSDDKPKRQAKRTPKRQPK